MRAVIVLLALAASSVAVGNTRSDAPLPAWTDEERAQIERSGWVPGASLLSDEASAEENAKPLDTDKPTPEEQAAETETPPNEIPEKFLPAYFDARPTSFLIDPQHLLDPRAARDRLAFLTNQAAESGIDFFLYIFDRTQEIPGEVREEELVERLFSSGRPAMLVFYFLGQPQRSVLYLSPSLTDAVPAAEQRRALSSSVTQALSNPDPGEQLEAFTVQMGIRLYWMDRMVHGDPPPPEGATPPLPRAKSHPAKPRVPISERLAPFRPWLTAAGGVVAAVLALMAFLWFRRRSARTLPVFEVEPRLGGGHAAGIGAVISFASPALPPARQRRQVPDYLKR